MARHLRSNVRRLILPLLVTCSVTGSGFANPLESLPTLQTDYKAARASSFDTSGGNVDFAGPIPPEATRVLAELDGPGMITHIWFTTNGEPFLGRKLVLRVYWDDEKDPSILSPLNDFFCMGHGLDAPMWSLPITTTADGKARNCFFKMPFAKKARLEITNEGLETLGGLYYYIDYRKYNKPVPNSGYFHARYRQEYPAEHGKTYLVCSAKGQGHYVGTVLSIESKSDGWWGEGDDRFYVDGETSPSLHGTGSEDYLSDAWGIWKGSSPYYGTSIFEGTPYVYPKGTRYTSYRFHIEDPIPFQKSLRMEMEHWGAGVVDGRQEGFVERADNWSSVAFWYQTEPHEPMEALPPVEERLPEQGAQEKDLYRFLRALKETSPTVCIELLREKYARFASDPKLAKQQVLLQARMARAEALSGNMEKAKQLLADYLEPFVERTVGDELSSTQQLLPTNFGPETPLLVNHEDGSVRKVQKDGKLCLATDSATSKSLCYFAFPRHSPLHNLKGTAVMRITYYSEGTTSDTFHVQYDSCAAEGLAGRYYNSAAIQKPAQAGWYTAEVQCPQALFAGRQNGEADFRISDDENGEEYIRSIEVIVPERP